ncbi:MAG: L-threonylcarbamoyladenylate synthase [Vicingaceae bacterium]|nr:L-threonylcarbamoyladenylate synthase [Vicingaceae bacterium]
MREEIQKCIDILNEGGIILYPTDTVWGLGCDATNEKAVAKIFDIKQREDSKSLITIVSSDGMLQRYVNEVPELAWDIMDLATKPTTIIYQNAKNLAKNCIAKDGSIGIRLIKDGFANQLVHRFNKPIISTSANISGDKTPSNYNKISDIIKNKVDFVVNSQFDTGTNQSSSILKLALNGEIKILRK